MMLSGTYTLPALVFYLFWLGLRERFKRSISSSRRRDAFQMDVGIGSADRRNFKELAVATTFKIATIFSF